MRAKTAAPEDRRGPEPGKHLAGPSRNEVEVVHGDPCAPRLRLLKIGAVPSQASTWPARAGTARAPLPDEAMEPLARQA